MRKAIYDANSTSYKMLQKRKMEKIKGFIQKKTLDNRGFSLVEIITVVVIILVLSAFAAPDILQWRENTRVTSAARDFIADLNNAKITAIQNNAPVVTSITTGDSSAYTVFVDDGSGTGATSGDKSQDGDEETVSTGDFTEAQYTGAYIVSSSITTPLLTFTPRGITEDYKARDILISNSDRDIWLKIHVSSAGALTLFKSVDSTDGSDGTWN